MIETKRVGENQRVIFGKDAFDGWADSLSDDACFQTESQLASPLDCYGSCIVQIATNIHYIDAYLKKAAALCPELIPLINKLEQAYAQVKAALKDVSDAQGGYFFDADRKALLRKDFRVKLAGLIRVLGERYMDVADVVTDYINNGL